MSVASNVRFASLMIWLVYLLVPTDIGGLLQGIPLGPIDAAALLGLAWVAWHQRPLPAAAVLAAVIAISAMTTFGVPGNRGFRARYFANAGATGAHERSTEFHDPAITRIDSRLDFAPGVRELPLAFFNDNSRFNFYQAGQPHRRRLEFAVIWTGWWWTNGGSHTLYLDTPQSTAQVSVDSEPIVAVTPESGPTAVEKSLARGWHRLHIQYSSPYAASRQFSAGEVIDGARRPFDTRSVLTRRVDEWQFTGQRLAGRVKVAADAAMLAWLAWTVWLTLVGHVKDAWRDAAPRPHHACWLFGAAGIIESLRFAWPWSRQLMLLAGGDDPLTYEGYARDILLNGILMNGGAPAGQGEPFYYQAFYPYFVALTHALFGEGMFGVMLAQRLLGVGMILCLTQVATDLVGRRVWPAALLCASLFTWWKFAPLAAGLANESLYVPLMAAWAAALVRHGSSPTVASAMWTGVLAGLTAITRSTALLSWAVIWPACGFRWWRLGRGRALAAMVAASLAVFSFIAIRNAVVAHVFVVSPTGLGVNLRGGNEPPPSVQLDLTKRAALYQRWGVSDATAEVIEFAISAPAAFAANMGRKALFALGVYEPYAPGWGYSPVYLAVWIAALGGIAVVLRSGHLPPLVALLPAAIAASQFVALVIVYPKNERLILPIHTMLVPYAAITLWAVVSRFRSSRPAGA